MTPKQALDKAVEIAGSQHKLATAIGCSQPNVSKMVLRGKATALYILAIERETGISRHDLSPALYPREGLSAA